MAMMAAKPRWLASALAGLLALAADVAWAQSGLQVSPDGQRTLVSKDVGPERWAITRNGDDDSVTGNVFYPGGGDPRFVWCAQTGTNAESRSFRCEGAQRCPLAPCTPDEWVFVADVSLPTSFFEPREAAGSSEVSSARAAGASAGSPSGLQVTRDRRRTLVSKDVGPERWAIARNPDDGTVTGNVFFPGGGDPQFVWCEQVRSDGETLGLRCLGADRCTGSTCPPEAWRFIADVDLPASFFEPDQTVAVEAVVEAIAVSLGEDDGFDALVLAFDRGYTLTQIVRAALTGRLLVSGEITANGGGIADPEGLPIGVFTSGGAAGWLVGEQGLPALTLDSFRALADGDAEALGSGALVLILLLGRAGYSLDQIVEGIVDPSSDIRVAPFDTSTIGIFDRDGNLVPPARPPEHDVIDPPAPRPSPSPVPTPAPTRTPAPTEPPGCGGTLCPDGSCFDQKGLVCCGGGLACPSGTVCVAGGCCPGSMPVLCPDDETCAAIPEFCPDPEPTPIPTAVPTPVPTAVATPTPVPHTPPTVTGVSPNPIVLPLNGSGLFTIFFRDPDGDVVTGCVAGASPGFTSGCASFERDGVIEGDVGGNLVCGSQPVTLSFVAYVVDAQGNESNRFPATLICQ
jgi:hypothetical protein